jgi:hypothetical protein
LKKICKWGATRVEGEKGKRMIQEVGGDAVSPQHTGL